MKKYSILIPVRNGLSYVKDCIQSVLMQDYNNYEIIVSDNHSMEAISEYVQSLNNPLIRLIKPASPVGMADHFEFALAHAQGEWIIFLGADDGLQPYFFDLCDVLSERALKLGLRVINGPRACFFWDGCESLYKDIKFSYSACSLFYKKNARLGLLNALIGQKEYIDLPQMYTTSIVHKSVVEKVKELQGGKFYSSLIPDANGAVNICSVESHYMECLIPLGWVGTSPRSNGFQFSADKLEGGNRLKDSLISVQNSWHPSMGCLQANKPVKILSTFSAYLFESLLKAHRLQSWFERTLYNSKLFKSVVFARMQSRMLAEGSFSDEQSSIFEYILSKNSLSMSLLKYFGAPLATVISFVFKLEGLFYRIIGFGVPVLHCKLHQVLRTGYCLVDASKFIEQKNFQENFVSRHVLPQEVGGWRLVAQAFTNTFRYVQRKLVKAILAKCRWEVKGKEYLYYTQQTGHSLDAPLIESFYDVINAPDFDEKLARLLSGLDFSSATTVLRIIERIKCTRGMQSCYYDFFTQAEKVFLNYQKFDFKNEVKDVEDSCFEISGYKFPINIGPVPFYYRYFINEIEQPENIEKKAIIDVGAYVGDSAVVFSPLKSSAIYCFEPVKKNYDNLLITLEKNELKNVVPVKMGLGAKKEQLFIADGDSASSYLKTAASNLEATEVTTLDSFVAENNIDHVGLIKVDIEGFEQHFLQGALNTIIKDKPVLLLSIYHSGTDFLDIKPFLENLNLGYKFKIRQQFCGSIFTETLLIAEVR